MSIVIPMGRIEPALDLQLDALLNQPTEVDFEIILSHNMPTPEGRRCLEAMLARRSDPRIRFVEATGRASAAHARNVGAAAAKARVLAFCDADDVVHPGWIDAMYEALDVYDAVTGEVVEAVPPGQEHWRPPATPGKLPEFHGTPYILSGNLGITRRAFETVEGFDERLTRCEDIAIGWKLQNTGHTLGYAPKAKLDYHHRAGLAKMLKQHFQYGRGMAEVLANYSNPLATKREGGGLQVLKANGQQHRRTPVSIARRGAIALGRLVGLVVKP